MEVVPLSASVAGTSVADTSVADTSVAGTSVADTSVAGTSVAGTRREDIISKYIVILININTIYNIQF